MTQRKSKLAPANKNLVAACECGLVTFDLIGAPIMTTACYCASCQKAAQQLEMLPSAPAVTDSDAGTHFVMHRKDRVRCRTGDDRLREYRLQPESATRRVVASCCNSAMFLEFQSGHWLSVYKNRIEEKDQPPLEMRTMTEDRRPGVVFADNIRSPEKHTISFMWKLLKAWAAMGFKTPEIDYVRGNIDV